MKNKNLLLGTFEGSELKLFTHSRGFFCCIYHLDSLPKERDMVVRSY